MRVLVIGGTRFMGPHIVRALVARGHELTVIHRGESEPELPDEVRHVHAYLAEFERHVGDLRALAPDVVLDMLALRREDARRVSPSLVSPSAPSSRAAAMSIARMDG